jgi:thiamine-phosphate pyrophosphorylase
VKPLCECRLYTFIDAAWLGDRQPTEIARQLCDGGSDVIQLRAKALSESDILRLAGTILPITAAAGVRLIINDHPKIAAQSGADGCHLGQEDFFDRGHIKADEITGCPAQFELGLSTHAPDQARRASHASPDYLAVGPVYQTPTKPTATAVTLDYVRWAAKHLDLPWFAIGGITLDNIDQVLEAGASRICVVRAILNQPHLMEACQRFKERLPSAPLK